MDPVLQRLGDVTIQRLDKPKSGESNSQVKNKEEDLSEEEENSEDGQQSVSKRIMSSPGPSNKKFKLDSTLSDQDPMRKNSDDGISVHNFSENEMSEYDSESDLETDRESIGENKSNLKVEPEDRFLDKLTDEPFLSDSNSKPPDSNSGDAEDYDYDIKEKLKEMGEISFETVKKGEKPKKPESTAENEVVVTPAKKSGEEENNSERKGVNMRRNIREVMDETKLDESTLAAQRQEMERLRRVQEQQRLIREVQRQMAQERMQHKVISLLQGSQGAKPGSSKLDGSSTVLVKLPNGQTKPMTRLPKRPFELLRVQKGSSPSPKNSHGLITVKKPQANLTPSVSIAPVTKKPMPTYTSLHSMSDTDSDQDEIESKPLIKPKEIAAKETPVDTIDISSDDDCIVVSETEGEPSEETEEDPSNSGMHTNDEFNQPDEQGRVVVNIGHPEDESDLYLAPQIARIIKPHQIGGIRFLFDNVIESTGRFDSSTGFGCILAHSMGLGKTLQVVSFSDIFLRHTSAKTILCIMPINTLQNWLAEFNMWLPTEEAAPNSPLQAHGEVRPRNFNLHVLNDSHKTLIARAKVIHEWKTGGGVLLIGYEQYRLLSLKKHPKSRKKPNAAPQPVPTPAEDDKNKALFDDVHEALVKPGPDLVICDEGHRIKNSHASISQALKQMRTKRRVVLTGYPLQNNLMEYWCMVDFVRPNYLGSKTEFCNMFERPIQNGQCIDSTRADIKLMRYRAHVLHSLLVGFVQRRSHTVLQTALPQKEEYVLLVRMTPFQRKLYETFMNEVVRSQSVPNPLKAFAVCCKIWNHPDVLYYFLKKRAGGEAVDIDLEEVSSANGTTNETATKSKSKSKKRPSKAKNAGKPAASVTPYNNSTDTNVVSTQQNSQPATAVSTTSSLTSFTPVNTNAETNFRSTQLNTNFDGPFTMQSPEKAPFANDELYQQNMQPFYNLNKQNFTQENPNYTSNFPSNMQNYNETNTQNSTQYPSTTPTSNHYPQNYQQNQHPFIHSQSNIPPTSNFQTTGFNNYNNYNNYQQNYWGQNSGYGAQNEFYNNCRPSYDQFTAESPWVKQEDTKPEVTNKQSETKPKINIISNIKIESPTSKISPEKKINILSDIKLDIKKEEEEKFDVKPEEVKNETKEELEDDVKIVTDMTPIAKANAKDLKEDPGIPYDWAVELLKDYTSGCIENSAKMEILFCIISESIALGDRLLVFSQSLITLDLIEQFLQMSIVPGDTQKWSRNTSYYRLDGSTSALEREKLINEFNSNPKIHLFLVSTRAGSLGINLVGANRVVVLDASWNPCHDTQAVCRVYRYGQRKPCFVYRLVVDNCLEKKIYDRQINKQGMSDRVVDECNPDAHLTMKDVSTLCWDDIAEEGEIKDWSHVKDNYIDVVLQKVLDRHGKSLTKEPFQHESLLVDRKDKQLSQQEKRLAKKGYEREKQAARQPAYNLVQAGRGVQRPIASVRPMQQGGERPSRWIPAEHWQRQGMTAQEMTLPLDVVIPTNQPDKGNIVLKAGQKVLVLKSPKGVYMQLENGKIVAIKTAIKVRGKAEDNEGSKMLKPSLPTAIKNNSAISVLPQRRMVKPITPGLAKLNMRSVRQPVPNLVSRIQSITKKVQMAKTKPYQIGSEIARALNQNDTPATIRSEQQRRITEVHGENPHQQAEESNHSESSLENSQDGQQQHPGGDISKNFRNFPNQKRDASSGTTLQQLEQSATAIMLDSKQPFQDTLDSITSSYQEEEKLDSNSSQSQSAQPSTLASCNDTQDQQQPQTPFQQQHNQQQQSNNTSADQPVVKTDVPGPEFGYNSYYNYNSIQPYHNPAPQGYASYPPPQPHYEMINYPQQPPQAQYNYYPQTFQPQPQYAPPPPPQGAYDYGHHPPPPPQPIYGSFHAPPYPPQQYPPPQGMYPPPAIPPNPPYPDYQYPQHGNAPPPPSSYYPNS